VPSIVNLVDLESVRNSNLVHNKKDFFSSQG
jgi:hypothetical protein